MPDWFTQEVDRVAMRDGITGSDAYLEAFAWSDEMELPGAAAAVAEAVVERLATEWRPPTHTVSRGVGGSRGTPT